MSSKYILLGCDGLFEMKKADKEIVKCMEGCLSARKGEPSSVTALTKMAFEVRLVH